MWGRSTGSRFNNIYLVLLLFCMVSLGTMGSVGCNGDGIENVVSLDTDSADSVNDAGDGSLESQSCVKCHTNKEALLHSLQVEPLESVDTDVIEDSIFGQDAGVIDVMEPWEKVLVSQRFLSERHFVEFFMGRCSGCHGGVDTAKNRVDAHAGLVAQPSFPNGDLCRRCHSTEVDKFLGGLHRDSRGIYDLERGQTALRANPARLDMLDSGLKKHCSSCHTDTCGSCHINRPLHIGGGLTEGHVFKKIPDVVQNCLACHGRTKGAEIYGNDGIDKNGNVVKVSPNVHMGQHELPCRSCHDEHIDKLGVYSRYDVQGGPRCEKCHNEVLTDGVNQMHAVHANSLSSAPHLQCQVCHAQPYKNCFGCHLEEDSSILEDSYLDFKIGKNPIKSAGHPYDYVLLRHVPVHQDTFLHYGKYILTSFDELPTWKYATPHNIISEIKVAGDIEPGPPLQARTCNSCHGQAKWFLTADDVAFDEVTANQGVILHQIPEPIMDN